MSTHTQVVVEGGSHGVYKYLTNMIPREGEVLHLPTHISSVKRLFKVKKVHHYFGQYEDHGPHMETQLRYVRLSVEFMREEKE